MAQDPDADGFIDVDNTVLTPSPLRIRNILTLEERVAAIRAYQQRPMYTKVARMFNCSWEQIKNIISNSDAIMEFYEATKNQTEISRAEGQEMDQKQRKIKFLGECVYEYIQRVQYHQKLPITEDMIRVKVMEFQDIMKLDDFTPNKKWMNIFKMTYNISFSHKQIILTRVPPTSLDLKDIMTYCTKNRCPNVWNQSVHMKDLKQKYNSLDAKTEEYESRRVRKLSFLQRALSEYLQRAKFHHKSLKLDDESVQEVAEAFNDILKVQDFYPTLSWIREFKQRHSADEHESSQVNKGSKKPLLSLDLKDILSYCGRMGINSTKTKACTITLTPKHYGPSCVLSKFPPVSESNLKFQQNNIIYLDDSEDAGDIKPDLEELKRERSPAPLLSSDRLPPAPPPLKIRKIESINNDPVLQLQLQQQHQRELQQERTKQIEDTPEELTKDVRFYIKAVKEEQLTDGRTYCSNESPSQLYVRDMSSSCGKSNLMPNGAVESTLSPKPNISPGSNTVRVSGGESLWQVANFNDALRFLKPLEEYAMLSENYRAIGLISQLEEVLRQQARNTKSEEDFNA